MKHKATIDLEFTNGDIFDQEVIKAMRAYAKTIAREAFQDEIQECIVDTAKSCAKRLYESRYGEPMTDKLVRKEVQSHIEKQMLNKNVLDLIQNTVSAEVKEYLTTAFIAQIIKDEIEKAIPQAVMDVLMKSVK